MITSFVNKHESKALSLLGLRHAYAAAMRGAGEQRERTERSALP
jgi:hypothetical protein